MQHMNPKLRQPTKDGITSDSIAVIALNKA
jgi:hypothetical protein